MNKIWTDTEIAFVKANASKLTDVQGAAKLSELLGRSVSVHAWRKQRQKMGLRKQPGRGVCKLVGDTATPIVPDDQIPQPEPQAEVAAPQPVAEAPVITVVVDAPFPADGSIATTETAVVGEAPVLAEVVGEIAGEAQHGNDQPVRSDF